MKFVLYGYEFVSEDDNYPSDHLLPDQFLIILIFCSILFIFGLFGYASLEILFQCRKSMRKAFGM